MYLTVSCSDVLGIVYKASIGCLLVGVPHILYVFSEFVLCRVIEAKEVTTGTT